MMKQLQKMLVLLALPALVLLAACGGDTADVATPTAEVVAAPATPEGDEGEDVQPVAGQATVDSIQVLTLAEFPVQVNVLARGVLADSCTQLEEPVVQRSEDTFRAVLTTVRQPDPNGCTETPVPFEETIPLDVLGLAAGTYNVRVNGIEGTFTLEEDNVAEGTDEPVEPTAEAEAPAEEAVAGTISGRVWHDVCAATGVAAADAGEEVPSGCVVVEASGTLQGDGERESSEEAISGAEVLLYSGACAAEAPADAQTATTDDAGGFEFTGLEPGTYCVTLNAASLDPGTVTAPADGAATQVELAADAAVSDLGFAYDYEALPAADADGEAAAAEDCTNSIEFVTDVTVPDDTQVPPGGEFTKTWRLRNSGTCPWTEEYTMVNVGGDPLGVTEPISLTQTVAVGEEADLSVDFTAPQAPDTYRSDWQIADAGGELFGVNGNIEDAFWVQIVVDPAADAAAAVATIAPGSGVIGGVVWEDVCIVQGDGSPGRGCEETFEGSGRYIGDGTLINEPVLSDIEVTLSQGPCPSDGVVEAGDILQTTTTGPDGLYRFEGLEARTYCVSIDAFAPANLDLLIPGTWTYPYQNVGLVGIVLGAGEERLTVDFGWDYQE